MVTISQPAACRSLRRAGTSSGVSPIPRMMLDFVTRPALRADSMTPRDRPYSKAGRTLLNNRGTVSTLCANTSGSLRNTSRSWSGLPLKSGINTSTPVSGLSFLMARTVSAYNHAPPSGRSSRATPVTVEYRSPMARTDSATRRGSSRSSGSGFPVSIWQKSHRRVHCDPPIKKVASRSVQHSKMLGQLASWQTVCRSLSSTSCSSSR